MSEKFTREQNSAAHELKEAILQEVRAELKILTKNLQPARPSEYVTRQEARNILKVSLVTISDWSKKGILKPYRLGNLIRYKRAELDQALININQ